MHKMIGSKSMFQANSSNLNLKDHTVFPHMDHTPLKCHSVPCIPLAQYYYPLFHYSILCRSFQVKVIDVFML